MVITTIGGNCNFRTQCLIVKSRVNQLKEMDSEKRFLQKVIEILSPNVTKTLPDGWQCITTIDDAHRWVSQRENESHFVTIQLSETNEIVGFIFLYKTNSEHKFHELRFGYLLSEKVWGKGFGTEAIEGLIKWCKKRGDIRSISAGVKTDNIASIKVLENNGFLASSLDNQAQKIVFYEYHFQ